MTLSPRRLSSRQALAAGVAAAIALAAAFALARRDGATASPQHGGPRPESVTVKESPQEVRDYWTPERMRAAKPMPLPPSTP